MRYAAAEGKSRHLLGAYILWGEAVSHFENRGRVPSHHVRQHLEAVAAGMRTFIVPNGFVDVEK